MLERDWILSGVFGLATGDALGVPVEFKSRELLDADPVKSMRGYGTHNQPRGTWSDDTSMTLATLDALSAGGMSTGRIMQCFIRWLSKAEYTADAKVFDVGNTTYNAIHNAIMGEPLELCGENSENSNGNGALMRMLPLVYYVYSTYGVGITPASVNCIYNVSSLTHAHIISKMCCVYYVYIGIHIMIFGKAKGIQKALLEAIKAVDVYYANVPDVPSMPDLIGLDSFKNSVDLDRDAVNSTGYVVDSLEASIWCLYHTSNYRDAVELAVNLGGDTDTIGAITGSLAGLYYGLSNIPKEWLNALKNKGLIEWVCNEFYEQYK